MSSRPISTSNSPALIIQLAAAIAPHCYSRRALAKKVGPRGIRVNAVETPGWDGTGTPEDVANAMVFLGSPKAPWLTDEVLDLSGGAHLQRFPDIIGHVMKLAAAP